MKQFQRKTLNNKKIKLNLYAHNGGGFPRLYVSSKNSKYLQTISLQFVVSLTTIAAK